MVRKCRRLAGRWMRRLRTARQEIDGEMDRTFHCEEQRGNARERRSNLRNNRRLSVISYRIQRFENEVTAFFDLLRGNDQRRGNA